MNGTCDTYEYKNVKSKASVIAFNDSSIIMAAPSMNFNTVHPFIFRTESYYLFIQDLLNI